MDSCAIILHEPVSTTNLHRKTVFVCIIFLGLRDIILMFWQLNASHSGNLTLDEFINVYDAVTLKWKLKDPIDPWFSAAWPPLRTICRAARTLVTWHYFEYIVCRHYLLLTDYKLLITYSKFILRISINNSMEFLFLTVNSSDVISCNQYQF